MTESKEKWTLPTLGTAAWLGAVLLLGFVLVGIVGPLILSDSPSAQDLDHLLEGPSRRHWLGTDENGCDLLVQLCYGARLLLGLCSSVVGLCLSLGLLIGVSQMLSQAYAGPHEGMADLAAVASFLMFGAIGVVLGVMIDLGVWLVRRRR